MNYLKLFDKAIKDNKKKKIKNNPRRKRKVDREKEDWEKVKVGQLCATNISSKS